MSASSKRQAINAAIKKIGLSALSEALGKTPWAIQKWRRQGYVPNGSLQDFCNATGVDPHQVWDNDLDFVRTNATKGSL